MKYTLSFFFSPKRGSFSQYEKVPTPTKIPLLPPLSENRELLTAKVPQPEFHPPVGEFFSEKMEGESVSTLNEAPPFPTTNWCERDNWGHLTEAVPTHHN
jgi:hypothetical protein